MTKAHSAPHFSSDLGLLCHRPVRKAFFLLTPMHGWSPQNPGCPKNCVFCATTIP